MAMAGSPIGGMDPGLIVSGISAVLQAAQTWIAYRDSRRAASVFRDQLNSGANTKALSHAAQQLSLAPAPVVSALGNRVQTCWKSYQEVLEAPPGSYMPNEVDDATEAVKRCVCRELKRLKSVNGSLPSGQFTDWWAEYGCQ